MGRWRRCSKNGPRGKVLAAVRASDILSLFLLDLAMRRRERMGCLCIVSYREHIDILLSNRDIVACSR